MNLTNLLTLECSLNYNQTKLQSVIRELQNKIASFATSIKDIENKCAQIENAENNSQARLQKFEQFAIDNLRQNHAEINTLKTGLRNVLGDQWIREESNLEVVPKSQTLDKIFESRLSAFNSEAKQISRKVSELKVELSSKTSQHEEQTEEVKQTIMEQKHQLRKIRQSIRQTITEEFSQYKKQFEEKNKEIYNKVQMASDASLRSIGERDEKHAQAIEKALNQYKRLSIGNVMPNGADFQNGKPETLNNLQSCSKLLMGGQDDNGLQDVIDFESDIRNKKKGFWSEDNQNTDSQIGDLNQLKISAGLGFLKNLQTANQTETQKPSQVQAVNEAFIEAKSMDHAINQLKEELVNMIKSDTLEFRTLIESLTAHSETVDSRLSNLSKESAEFKKEFAENIAKITDIKSEIDNIKHSLYENNERHNQNFGKIVDAEQKISSIQEEIKNLTKDIQVLSLQDDEGDQSSRFRDIKNINRAPSERNSVPRTSLYKNSTSTPSLNNQNVIVSRLNLLTEKLSKVQEKLKSGSFGSDKNLPRIGSSTNLTPKNNGNTPSFDILKKDLQMTNEELNKTNERLMTLKKHLKELEAAHNLIPNRISKLETQVTQINEIQEDRLLELIKELINRVLTDPFNNHFTNTLKRQIHVKFLEIKHEYSSIWKDIETKVTDRAETAELEKLKENIETQNIEIKALINKKADNDDFKKGIKYIDTKLKEVYSYLKGKEDFDNSPQGRKYYMGKKA